MTTPKGNYSPEQVFASGHSAAVKGQKAIPSWWEATSFLGAVQKYMEGYRSGRMSHNDRPRTLPLVEISREEWADIFYEACVEAEILVFGSTIEDNPTAPWVRDMLLKAADTIMRMVNSPVEEVNTTRTEEFFT